MTEQSETDKKSEASVYMQDMALTLGMPTRFLYKEGENVVVKWFDVYGQPMNQSNFDRFEKMFQTDPGGYLLLDIMDQDSKAVDFNVTRHALLDLLKRPVKINGVWHDAQGEVVRSDGNIARMESGHQKQ